MVDSGLVEMTEAGSARLYVLNREPVAADAVLALLDLRGKLFSRIRDRVAAWTVQPVAAAVFGSAARGDGDLDSDVDVFIIRPEDLDADEQGWADQRSDLAERIARWSGNHASLIEATPSQVREMVDREEPIVGDLRRDAVPMSDRHVLDVTPVRR